MFTSLLLMVWIRFFVQWDSELFWLHAREFVLLYPFWLIVLYVFDQYDVASFRLTRSRGLFFSAIGISFLIGLAFFYLLPHNIIAPKTNLLIHVVLFGILAFFWRTFYFHVSAVKSSIAIGLFRSDPKSAELAELIRTHAHLGYTPIFLDMDENLPLQISAHHLSFLVMPSRVHTSASEAQRLYDCLGLGVTFLEPVHVYEYFERKIPLSIVDQTWFLKNMQEKEGDWNRLIKRILDVGVAFCVLLVSSPLWLIISLAIKLDDHGPLFYRQTRVGKYGHVFSIWKFRSMSVKAEEHGTQWATKHDPRATRMGKWLRLSHLDELPQVLNILRGDISFVGPRPERPEFVAQLKKEIPHYHLRHLIQPGFTGWAQVRFRYARSVEDSREKFEYDLYYIKNRSFLLDGLILLKTARLLFRGE